MKIITVAGTRPELIRLCIIIDKLDTLVDHRLIYTNQNYDHSLSGQFFDELKIRKPDYIFKKTDGFSGFLGNAVIEFEKIILKEEPDKVLILGDTNSGLVSIIADRHKIPVYHMEAGNRCYDKRVPEETNRRLIDHLSKYNLPYTENSKYNLLNEGFHKNNIFKTGNPIYEVLNYYKSNINNSSILNKLNIKEQEFVLVTAHRSENVDNIEVLSNIMKAINEISKQFKVIFSLHPRTKDKLNKFDINVSDDVVLSSPFGFFDFVKLEGCARCVISDCLHPDTFVILNTGLVKKIDDISVGDTIISDNSYGVIQAKESKKVNLKYKFITKYNEIKCSENHRLFIHNGKEVVEKKAKDINKLDRILSLCSIKTAGDDAPILKRVDEVDYIKINNEGNIIIRNKSKGNPLKQFGRFKNNTLYSKKGVSRERLYNVLDYLNIDKVEFEKYIYYDESIAHKRQIKINQPLFLNENIAEFVGFLCGDGFVVPGNRVSLYDQNKENLIHFNNMLKKCFDIKGKFVKDPRSKCIALNIYSKTMSDFLGKNFYPECQTTLTKKKDISDIIMSASSSIVAAYIRGLFEAEGSVGDHSFAITMSDKVVIEKLKYLLLRFGIITNIYRLEPRREKDKSTLYQLAIYEYNSRVLFRDKIGFISNYKKDNTVKLFDKINKCKFHRPVKRQKDIFFDLIRKIEVIEDDEDYIDINVQPHNTFLANGLLSHNSGTVQEECNILGVPAITIRESTERQELVECGSSILSGTEYASIIDVFNVLLKINNIWTIPSDYLVENVSDIVINILMGKN